VVRASENGADSSAFARREQIINAARAVIEEYGSDALTGQIAQRAGLARPNVYRHFASKDELDQAVVSNAYQELRTEIRARLDLSGTPLDVIRAPLEVQISWADRHPNLYRFLLSRGHQRSSQLRQAERRNFAADLATVGEHYFPHFADDRDAAAALVGALGGLIDASVLGWLSRRTESRERLTERLTTQVWLLIDQHLRDIGVHIDPAVPLPQLGPTAN
jgi:AcrR family transcriptional regulator